jgi:GAF domain-containing protein
MNLQSIMDRMAEHFRPDAWSLLLVDHEREELYFELAAGGAADSLKGVRLKLGEGIAGWVAKNGERLIIPDVYTDPRFAKRIDEMTKWQTRSIICVPLLSKHKVLGVIQLINVDQDSFSDHELFFLQSLCDNAAAAIEAARELEHRGKLDAAGATTRLK